MFSARRLVIPARIPLVTTARLLNAAVVPTLTLRRALTTPAPTEQTVEAKEVKLNNLRNIVRDAVPDDVRLPIISLDNEPKGELALAPNLFLDHVRTDILHRVVTWQLAGRRQGSANSKNRSEVHGSNKKPWRQKGTGRARHGSRKGPQWRHGASQFGPKPKDWSFSLPRKVRHMGMRSALSLKLLSKQLFILENIELEQPKTKVLAAKLKKLGWDSALMIDDGFADRLNTNFGRAAENLHYIDLLPPIGANVYDILNHDVLVLTPNAVQGLTARLSDRFAVLQLDADEEEMEGDAAAATTTPTEGTPAETAPAQTTTSSDAANVKA